MVALAADTEPLTIRCRECDEPLAHVWANGRFKLAARVVGGVLDSQRRRIEIICPGCGTRRRIVPIDP